MEIQKKIFEIAKSEINPNLRLIDVVCEILGIGLDAAYRRLNGKKELSLSELMKICSHFNISIDTILNYESDNVLFRYYRLDLNNPDNYEKHLDELAKLYERVIKSKFKEILMTAQDVPIFHLMQFVELTFFKFYSWNQSICGERISYEKFISMLDRDKLSGYYKRIADTYKQTCSTEVWVGNTIDSILRLLDYHHDMNCFENKEHPVLLCRQLLQLIENLEKWAENECKGESTKKIPFSMYLSPVNLENNFIISKTDNSVITSIKLYTINGIFTSHSGFCEETEKWVRNAISKSLSLSGSSERERFRFFQQMKNKINKLKNKFEK